MSGEIFRTCPDLLWDQPRLLYNGYRVFPGVKSGQGVTLITHPFYCRGHERVELYLYSAYEQYGVYRASVPVQGYTLPLPLPQYLYKGALYLYLYLSVCTRVHFTFNFTSVPVQG